MGVYFSVCLTDTWMRSRRVPWQRPLGWKLIPSVDHCLPCGSKNSERMHCLRKRHQKAFCTTTATIDVTAAIAGASTTTATTTTTCNSNNDDDDNNKKNLTIWVYNKPFLAFSLIKMFYQHHHHHHHHHHHYHHHHHNHHHQSSSSL